MHCKVNRSMLLPLLLKIAGNPTAAAKELAGCFCCCCCSWCQLSIPSAFKHLVCEFLVDLCRDRVILNNMISGAVRSHVMSCNLFVVGSSQPACQKSDSCLLFDCLQDTYQALRPASMQQRQLVTKELSIRVRLLPSNHWATVGCAEAMDETTTSIPIK